MADTGWADVKPMIEEFLLSFNETLQELTAGRLPQICRKVDSHGGNVMHWAARKGLVSMVDFLTNNLDSPGVTKLVITRDDLGNTPLHYACHRNYEYETTEYKTLFVDRLVNCVPDNIVLVKNVGGVSALHWACRYGGADVVKRLLNCFKPTDTRPFKEVDEVYGTTALHWACRYDKPDIVRLLLQTCPKQAEETMLMLKSKNADCPDEAHFEAQLAYDPVGTDSVTDHVVLPKTNGGSSAFHWACLHGHQDVVRVFIEELSESTLYELCAAQDDIFGNTVIHWICGRGHLSILEHIITAQKKRFKDLLLIKSRDHNTALHWACGRGHLDVFNLIADEMVSDFQRFIMEKNKRGENASHWACYVFAGHHLIVAAILERLEPLARESLMKTFTQSANSTALHWACQFGHTRVVEEIFNQLPPDSISKVVQMKNNRGLTALHVACSVGHANIVDKFKRLNSFLLFKLVADKNNDDHRCAIDTVIALKRFAILSVLLSSERELFGNILQNIRTNVVVEACRRGENDAVCSILDAAQMSDRKGDLLYQFLKATDDDGKSVIHIACRNRERNVIEKLLLFLQKIQEDGHNIRDLFCSTDGKNVLLECSHLVDEGIVQIILDVAANSELSLELLQNSFWGAFEMDNVTIVTCVLKQAEKLECLKEVLFHTKSQHRNQTVVHRSCQHRYGGIKCLEYVLYVAERKELLPLLLFQRDSLGRTFLFYTEDARSEISQILVRYVTVLDARYKEPHICNKLLTNRDNQNKTVLRDAPATRTQVLCQIFSNLYETLSKGSSPANNDEQEPTDDASEGVRSEFEDIVRVNVPSDFHLLHDEKPFAYELLDNMGSTKCLELIQHNYTRAYLQVCWERFVLKFFLINFVLYAFFLLFLTGFVVSHKFQLSHNDRDSNVSATRKSPSFGSSIQFSIIPIFTNLCQYSLTVATVLIATNEVIQMCAKGRNYWKTPGNYADIAVTVGSLVISLATIISGYQPWVHQLGVVTMCVAWINGAWMMTFISPVPHLKRVSLMFVMLFRVIKSVLLFLPVFGVFVFCMSSSYYSLMHNQPSFQNLGYSLMKSLTMTVGEMEFTAMFFPDDEAEIPPFYVLTCIMFVVFLGIMNIAMINLLVGRAVGDIQQLNSQSEIIAFESMVDLTKESQAMDILIAGINCDFSCQPTDVARGGSESVSLTSRNPNST